MRNVTIKRAKRFAGCLGKMKVYLEDPTANGLTIDHVSCRKVGELKNGGETTFSVGDQATKIFVIADKLSKDYCNEYYQLPEGQEDVVLSGKNEFNPATGNAFRFDENETEEVVANRKRNMRKGIVITIFAVLAGIAIGFLSNYDLFFSKEPEAKTFSSHGMTITLTDEFRETDIDAYTVAYDSPGLAVFALKEEFSLAEGFGDNSLEQYVDLVLQAAQLTSVETKSADGLMWFEYEAENTEVKETYHYFAYVYKTNDAFWLVQFATMNTNAESYAANVAAWAKSISFAD